ncbi:helix-turn-helix transcriptional regulator [Arthrobacter sp. KNU-44]|uniref:helix-turn-helix transcriptional regulator n=1 Tax=Arthrobacter sp. KNU-44 TaxID=3450744 RepID=UPI003F428FBC
MDSFAEENAYRAVMEALNNAVKHSQAQAIDITVTDLQDTVVITVADNGRGFDPSVLRPGHLGMETMHERADVIEAYFELHTAAGEGTTIQLSIPASIGIPKQKKMNKEAGVIKVFIVDDHAVVRRGLAAYLSGEDGIDVIGQAENGRRTLGKLVASFKKNSVVVLNLVQGVTKISVADIDDPAA